ncbi:hypothetical protein LOD99_6832 [Oopsacas minuta]|uniref:Transmembrane protein 127 transmembrane region domain-containing protein n=1 Tax=Oopsacas minuta TaxID=111878 RepID=A0AAV7JJK6_9METZ|nr:hypothetical protein LOD99_6832 [Oopsacas minuta]
MSNVEVERENSPARTTEEGASDEPLVEPGITQDTSQENEDGGRRRNYVSLVFALLSVVLVLGAIAIPNWTKLVSTTDGIYIGEYGLFLVKLLKVGEDNETTVVYQNLFEFYNPGELSLIVCIVIILLFNMALTVSGVIVSLGCCPAYLNFLASFSVFNIFACVNYLAIMGLWLWVTDRIPYHNTDDPIRKIYTDVYVEFDYGYYLIILCTALLTIAAVFNILDMRLFKNGCFRKKYR